MDWDLAIKRNSEALKGIIAVLFAMLGLDGTDAASRIPRSAAQRRAARAPARRIRRAAADRHCGPGCCGEAGSLAAHARRTQDRKGRRELTSLLPALRSAETFPKRQPRV